MPRSAYTTNRASAFLLEAERCVGGAGYFGSFAPMNLMFAGLLFGGLGGFDMIGDGFDAIGDGIGDLGDSIGDTFGDFGGFDF